MASATAQVARHAIAAPYLVLGIAIARWPRPVAAFYAKVFEALGYRRLSRSCRSPAGVWYVRIFGVAFGLISAYWVVVGTG